MPSHVLWTKLKNPKMSIERLFRMCMDFFAVSFLSLGFSAVLEIYSVPLASGRRSATSLHPRYCGPFAGAGLIMAHVLLWPRPF